MSYLKFILLIFSLIFLYSCNNENKKITNNQATIDIVFEGANYSSIIYLNNIGSDKTSTIDSAIVENNKSVHFTINMDQSTDIYSISFSANESIKLILDNGENANIKITGTPVLPNYSISGSPASLLTQRYALNMLKHTNYHDSIYMNYRNSKDLDNFDLVRITTDSLLKANYNNTYISVKNMIVSNPSSIASLLGIYSTFGNSTVLNIEYDYDVFKLLSDSLISKYPNNTHVIALNNKVNNIEEKNKLTELRYNNLDKGHKIPVLNLKSLDNTIYSIYNNTSKLRILYLWKPNTKSFYDFNTILRNIHDKYSKDELEIITVSFEKDKLAWSNLCRMEKLNEWKNLIADENTEDLINPKKDYSIIYLLGKDNEILFRTTEIDDLRDISEFINK